VVIRVLVLGHVVLLSPLDHSVLIVGSVCVCRWSSLNSVENLSHIQVLEYR
jgi:hypothetical protein